MLRHVAFILLLFAAGFVYSVEFLDPGDLKPGMKGYGLTVFKGWEPERFEVEIIDVMRNSTPKGNIILARVKGNILEQSGVIAGMSGSPVYIDGKLIGAVALAWPFSKEPVCGITPIGEMLTEKRNREEFGRADPDSSDRMKKIRTPVFLSGFVGEAKEYVSGLFGAGDKSVSGGSFVLTGGNGENAAVGPVPGEKKLKEGDAVAVNMVDGDFSVQGIGTVTYVSNNDVFIFGHPMDLAGNTDFPISRAYIYSVIPNSQISFKLGSASAPVGVARYDGQHAVYCELNARTGGAMVPVSLKIVKSGSEQKEYEYRFRVADNKNYFPVLTSGAISSAFLNHAGSYDDKRIVMEFSIVMTANGRKFTARNRFLYALNPAYFSFYSMLGDLTQYLSIFYGNNFSAVKIESVGVTLTVEKDLDYYTLDYLSVDKPSYYPGETVRCRAQLREYRGNFITKDLFIRIPDSLPAGSYWILAASEMTLYTELSKLFPKYFIITSLDELLRMANLGEDSSLLTASLIAPRQGMVVRDKKMEKFPENYMSFFNRTADKNAAAVFPDIVRRDEPMTGAVFGSLRLNISVINRTIQSAE